MAGLTFPRSERTGANLAGLRSECRRINPRQNISPHVSAAPAFARNEIDGLAAGDPVDIPADQFVSVRVEMPADSIWNQRQSIILADQEPE